MRSQADDGYLYPLEKGFFYVHKPPTLLVYDEVESIEFMRQGAGVLSNSAKTFDLAVRMKHDQVGGLNFACSTEMPGTHDCPRFMQLHACTCCTALGVKDIWLLHHQTPA